MALRRLHTSTKVMECHKIHTVKCRVTHPPAANQNPNLTPHVAWTELPVYHVRGQPSLVNINNNVRVHSIEETTGIFSICTLATWHGKTQRKFYLLTYIKCQIVNVLSVCGIHCQIALISVHFQSLDALSCVLIFLNSSDFSSHHFVFTVVLLSQYIRCNDKATVSTISARMSLVCLAQTVLLYCLLCICIDTVWANKWWWWWWWWWWWYTRT